ncbi:MAG: phosphonate monoester hydrolase, partial [Pseudomonadota bacterium]
GETPDWREFVVSEFDFSPTPQSVKLGFDPMECRLFMVFDGRYKLMHSQGAPRPMLFDLEDDPDEFDDLAKGNAHAAEIDRLYGMLGQWGRRCAQRVTKSDSDIVGMRGRSMRRGILPFLVDGSEVPEELTQAYRGKAPKRFTEE